ncbi:LCP family protein [Lentibacillus halophilus]|uniref:LCP family protein n=1 Tax=Lentibacillus halophilus TaxID=295065 RepID=A0ABP3J5R4_9BACI
MAHRRHKKRKLNKKRIFLVLLIPIIIIASATIAYGMHLMNKAENTVDDSYQSVDRDNQQSSLRHETVNPIEDNVSILIIGVDNSDKRDYEYGRSDALMLATFNKDKQNVKLVSIPRDTYTYIPEVGYNTKINHAHAYGGPSATLETVENFMNVPVDYYVQVNFNAFIETVNSLGGIPYDVPFEMYEMNSDDEDRSIHLLPGEQELNGEEALALARSRKYDNDIKRGGRQRDIIKTIVDQATSVSSITKIGNLIDSIGNNMKTNISFNEMKSFAKYGLNQELTMESITLKGDGGYMDDGLWYYQVRESSRAHVEKTLRKHLDLPIQHQKTTEFTNKHPDADPAF